MTKAKRQLSRFYFVYFAATAAFIPSLPLIFDDAGFLGSEIGWLLCLLPAMAEPAEPAWGESGSGQLSALCAS